MADPIRMRCEGSNQPGHRINAFVFMCSMCGANVPELSGRIAVEHDRDDVLAVLDRGDFDG